MKKLYSFAILLMLACSTSYKSSAQTDLGILHNIQDGDTIKIMTTNPPQYVFVWGFVNYGPNALTQTDTLFISTPYITYKITLPPGGLAVNDTTFVADTTGFNSGPATGPSQWCDSIWAKNSSNAVIADPVMGNNKLCNTIYILNTPSSIGDKLNGSKSSNVAKLQVYPNPAVNAANFDYYTNNYSEAFVSVTDITGRQVYKKDLGSGQGARKANLDIAGLSNGVYIVELRAGNIKQVGKFVIQK